MQLYSIKEPDVPLAPIVISVPHAGVAFPEGLKEKFDERLSLYLDDTDWYVDLLYDFAPKLGITVMKAHLSRWVIDLNRDYKNIPLYDDGRITTAVVPTTDFFGNKLYKSPELEPDQKEIEFRIQSYYNPYYDQLRTLLDERKNQFNHVLLWDGHSIRHMVSTIYKHGFPDMILGDNLEKTAHPKLIKTALDSLNDSKYKIAHNKPFRGGHITRNFGDPQNNIHTLQLEMNKILYMDDNELTYNTIRAAGVKELLENTMINIIQTLKEL